MEKRKPKRAVTRPTAQGSSAPELRLHANFPEPLPLHTSQHHPCRVFGFQPSPNHHPRHAFSVMIRRKGLSLSVLRPSSSFSGPKPSPSALPRQVQITHSSSHSSHTEPTESRATRYSIIQTGVHWRLEAGDSMNKYAGTLCMNEPVSYTPGPVGTLAKPGFGGT